MALDTQTSAGSKQWTTKDILREALSGLPPQVRDILQEYMREILAGLLIIVLAVSLWYGYLVYKTRQEDRAATELGLAIEKRDPAKEIPILKVLVQQHTDTMAGRQALLLLGAAYRDSGQMEAAEKAFDRARHSLPKGSFLYYSALMGLGYLEEDNSRLDKAMELYKSSSKSRSGLETTAVIDLARVSSALGKKEEAIKAYNRYLSLRPKSWQSDFVRDQIMRLSAQGRGLKKGPGL